jgi:CheY-like chemotaxis protein
MASKTTIRLSLILFANMPNKVPVRILIIDDDALSRELLQLLLSHEGYAIEIAESGEAALETIRGQQAMDAVLADLQMPGVRGAQLARELHSSCGDQSRLIAMSASPPAPGELQGYDAFLLKPFSAEALAAILCGNVAPASNEPIRQNVTVLDQTVYDKLAGAMRPELVAQLYALCITDAKKRVTAMRDAAARGDDAAYRREAHAIKGGTGMVGALELQTIATTMEDLGITANYVATLDEFLIACNRVERMLIAHETVPDHSVTAEATRRNHA